MGTILEQRPAVGTEAEPEVIRQPGRGPIWPFIVAGLALVAVVVAGVMFFVLDDEAPFEGSLKQYVGQTCGSTDTECISTEAREAGAQLVAPPIHLGVGQICPPGASGATGCISTQVREGGGEPLSGFREVSTQVREGGGEPLSGYQEVSTQVREGGGEPLSGYQEVSTQVRESGA
jgi:hypothetical protein